LPDGIAEEEPQAVPFLGTDYMQNTYSSTLLPLLKSTLDGYAGIIRNYLTPAFGSKCLRDLSPSRCRKSDVQESQWLMKLHTYRLLRNTFCPPQEIRTLRTYWRQRNDRRILSDKCDPGRSAEQPVLRPSQTFGPVTCKRLW
jgi:hypothetical protein